VQEKLALRKTWQQQTPLKRFQVRGQLIKFEFVARLRCLMCGYYSTKVRMEFLPTGFAV
jgi:hypothetical protein